MLPRGEYVARYHVVMAMAPAILPKHPYPIGNETFIPETSPFNRRALTSWKVAAARDRTTVQYVNARRSPTKHMPEEPPPKEVLESLSLDQPPPTPDSVFDPEREIARYDLEHPPDDSSDPPDEDHTPTAEPIPLEAVAEVETD